MTQEELSKRRTESYDSPDKSLSPHRNKKRTGFTREDDTDKVRHLPDPYVRIDRM